ncbi:MAG TPA: GIY-YIG nuclease family protein [Woeseiaceae bacterium]
MPERGHVRRKSPPRRTPGFPRAAHEDSKSDATTTSWSLYLLRCADGAIYTGITTDVARRYDDHQSGTRGSKYLRGRRPLELLYQRCIGNRSQASRIEHRVRNLPRIRKEDVAQVDAVIDCFLSQLFPDPAGVA